MAVLLMLYAAWQVVGALFAFLEERAERTESQMDDILLSFLTGIVRLIMVIAAAFEIGALLSLPTTGILAGLSIGGLAMAIASKETLSNIFGAGILLGDRPFQKGDRIVAGEVNGWVEEVGLRSTRIRTMYDSLLIVPNGKLADSSINNFGARRRRTLLTSFPVTSGGTPEALSAFTSAVTERIASDPMYEPGQFEVNVKGITFEGIQVELYATLTTRSGHAARAANHRLFLDIVKLARAGGMNLGVGTEMEPHHTE
jgi:MscS family membrane protein